MTKIADRLLWVAILMAVCLLAGAIRWVVHDYTSAQEFQDYCARGGGFTAVGVGGTLGCVEYLK